MDILHISSRLNYNYHILIKNYIFIFLLGMPFLGLFFNGLLITFIYFIVLFYEFFNGTKKSNFTFILMGIVYFRLYMLPPIESGEVNFYIDQLNGVGELSLISFLEPVTFFLLKYFNIFFYDPMTTIKFFRVFTAVGVFITLYNLVFNLNLNRQTSFLLVFSFMFWHVQFIGFEADQFKNFFAQIIFLLFLITSIHNNNMRYLFLVLLPLTHLTYAIVGFFIFLFQSNLYKNTINYFKYSLFVISIFIGLLWLIPKLGIGFLSLSQRVQDYVNYSIWKWDEQLIAKGGYLYTEILSTNAIWTYIMIFFIIKNYYLLKNTTFRYLFISWLTPFLISKLYLLGIPFVVDRFIMLFHGFWIIISFAVFDKIIVKGTRFKFIKYLFVLYLGIVTIAILYLQQSAILKNVLMPNVNNFYFHFQAFIAIYIMIFIIMVFNFKRRIKFGSLY